MTLRRGRLPILALVLSLAPLLPLHAQGPTDLLTRGVQAYRDLDFDAAVGFLHRWFAADAERAREEQVDRGLIYLGASELFRGNPDSATAAFQRLILRAPRYQVDAMTFPPEVTELFASVRRRTKAVALSLPDSVSLGAGRALTAWAYASSLHDIRAQVQTTEGRVLRRIYVGPISDSLLLRWSGRDSTDRPLASGSYFLTVTSLSTAGRVLRILQVPFDLRGVTVDTLADPPAPADSLFLPERLGSGPGVEALLGGLASGVAVAALPSLMASGSTLSPARFALAGSVGLAAIVGYVTHRPGRPNRANVKHNTALREAWRAEVARVTRENVARRAASILRIHFGPPSAVDVARQ